MKRLIATLLDFSRHSLPQPVRLDLFLCRRLGLPSRRVVTRIIREGSILVNGRRVKASKAIHPGDRIDVNVDPEFLEGQSEPLGDEHPGAEVIPLRILYEDRHLLVLDKEPGIAVHPGAGRPGGTVVNALMHFRPEIRGVGAHGRPGVVHRLDIDTSGILLVAKDPKSHRALSLLFRTRAVEKEYLALVWGIPTPSEGSIDAPIGRSSTNRKKMSVLSPKGRDALTRYHVDRRFSGFSLINAFPHTGRTHQIRVHLCHLGHPIVGDRLYGRGRWKNVGDPVLRASLKSFPRQALHARRLRFGHPFFEKTMEFRSPIPEDMTRLIDVISRG